MLTDCTLRLHTIQAIFTHKDFEIQKKRIPGTLTKISMKGKAYVYIPKCQKSSDVTKRRQKQYMTRPKAHLF